MSEKIVQTSGREKQESKPSRFGLLTMFKYTPEHHP